MSSFSSFPSGNTGVSKAQLFSSCCWVATLWPHCYSHICSYFFVAPSVLCGRGLGSSHTKSLKLPTFHVASFLIPLVWGRLKGWWGTFALLSFTAPPPQCKKPFSSKSLSSRQKIICKLLHHLCSLTASLISLICESLLMMKVNTDAACMWHWKCGSLKESVVPHSTCLDRHWVFYLLGVWCAVLCWRGLIPSHTESLCL